MVAIILRWQGCGLYLHTVCEWWSIPSYFVGLLLTCLPIIGGWVGALGLVEVWHFAPGLAWPVALAPELGMVIVWAITALYVTVRRE